MQALPKVCKMEHDTYVGNKRALKIVYNAQMHLVYVTRKHSVSETVSVSAFR
jgi:hypothetical protein